MWVVGYHDPTFRTIFFGKPTTKCDTLSYNDNQLLHHGSYFFLKTYSNIMKSSICWQDNHKSLDGNRKCQKFGPKPGATNCDFCSECDSSLVSFVGTTSWSPWFITILDDSAIKNNSHHNSGFPQLWRVFGSTHLDRTQSACIPSQPFFRMK